ncbi:hypothetical protein ACTOB_000206 [Actinoplanes oblitus]|uniref:Uncharacterized protein n=1 Tax=Actinoplanes oblitus TaxID=3040509 RepID=A0ABY8WFV1_9ACTN|nr:hypothetical protein [Actinoplanes oblitus]WIM96744.1 hypothetical protein ACTOB_000206 [Actinoplanes oblitus]
MTMPITTAAANNADLTMPVVPASNDSDMTMPVSLATPGGSDMTMPVNLATSNIDATMPVNLATSNIDATMPVNVVAMPPGAVPGQRGQGGQPGQLAPGTLYSTGGYPSIDMTMPVSDPAENSGSLTGHILAQGWYDAPVEQRRGNFKVVLAMLVVLGLLVTVSLVFLFTVGDSFSDMLKGIAN